MKWKITVEVELESPDILMGGVPVSDEFIEKRLGNLLAQMTRGDPFSPWKYTEAKVLKVTRK